MLKIDSVVLEEYADKIDGLADNVFASLRSIDEYFSDVSDNWSGSCRDMFFDSYNSFKEKEMSLVYDKILEISAMMRVISNNYENADSESVFSEIVTDNMDIM